MMRTMSRALVLGLAVAAASSAWADPAGEGKLAQRLEGRTAGPPIDCVRLSSVLSTEIVDGTAILYRMPGGRVLVNRPRSGASILRRDDILVTRTPTGQLCAPDTVQLVDSLAHFQKGFVALGPFVPYSKAGR